MNVDADDPVDDDEVRERAGGWVGEVVLLPVGQILSGKVFECCVVSSKASMNLGYHLPACSLPAWKTATMKFAWHAIMLLIQDYLLHVILSSSLCV